MTPDLLDMRRCRTAAVDAGKLNRVPPHSLPAEQGALSCILLDAAACIPLLLEKNAAPADLFYDLKHSELLAEILAMYEAQDPVNVSTLCIRLQTAGKLESVAGMAYVSQVADAAPSAANFEWYLGELRDLAIRRQLIRTCAEIEAEAYGSDEAPDKLLDEAESRMMAVSTAAGVGQKAALLGKDVARAALDALEFMAANKGAPTGLATGFAKLDEMTGGLQPGDMVVVAARPSVGKTSLAMNIAEHVAVDKQIPVGVFSLEMNGQSLGLRLVCGRAGVNLRDARSGFFQPKDFAAVNHAVAQISKAPLVIDDSSGLSILQLRAKARRMHQQHGIQLLVVDYLQLLHSTNRRAENRQQEVADISNGIKALAKELNIPVLALCQLNRESEKRELGARPRLSDLRESGSIEQDADVVLLMYKDIGEEEDELAAVLPVNVLVAKQRNGPTGEIPLSFNKAITRFHPRVEEVGK